MNTINKIDSLLFGNDSNDSECGYGYIDGIIGGLGGNVHRDGDDENPFYLDPNAKEECDVWNYDRYHNGDGSGKGF